MYDYSFGQFAFAYWWLIFPMMWFVFGLLRMWMRYRQHRETLELMKTYAAQGKDPSELAKTLQVQDRPDWLDRRHAPGGEWKGGVILLAIAAAFAISGYAGFLPDTDGAFQFIALITGLIGAALIVTSFVTRSMMSGSGSNEK